MTRNLKKNISAMMCMLLIFSMLASMMVGCNKEEDEGKVKFTVGFDAEFPPYGYKDEATGEYIGFDLSLAEEVCKRNGWELVKQPIAWDSKDVELKTKSIDCIWNGFTINGRETEYTWSKAYVDNSQVVVVKKDSDIKSLADLKNKIVIVQTDSSALAAFTGDGASEENKELAASFKELMQVGDYNSAFMNLESGVAQAVCMDAGVANFQVRERGNEFVILDERVSSEFYGVGFLKGNTELRDKVQATLDEMNADGTFTKIAKEWELEDSVCLGKEGTDGAYLLDKGGETKKLTVGFDAEFPPYGYKDEATGEYIGFDLSLAEEVCKRNGWEFVKQPIAWDSKDIELKSGAIDCIWNGFTINGRENEYTWSKAYVDNSQVVVVKKDSDIKSLNDLKDKVVIVQTDSSALAAFTGDGATQENKDLAASFKELMQVGDYNLAFMNLESGVAQAICMDSGVANFQVRERGEEFIILDERVSSEFYGVGFLKGNTALRDKVQATLDEMNADGTFAKIAKEWGLEDSVCLGKEGTDEAYLLDQGDSISENKKNEKEEKSIVDDIMDVASQLSKGMIASLTIFFLTLAFSLPLGLVVMFMRTTKFLPLQWLAKLYISIMRGTPLMLQLLVVFFGPYYIFDINLSYSYRFYAVIIGFSLNYAAYFGEIFRAGMEGIPVGQQEAAYVLGYTKGQIFRKIKFPQMVKAVVPPVTNEVITLVKDTSLAFALAYTEMFTVAKQVAAARASIMPLFVAGVFYFVFNFVVAFVMEKIEKKLQYYI